MPIGSSRYVVREKEFDEKLFKKPVDEGLILLILS